MLKMGAPIYSSRGALGIASINISQLIQKGLCRFA